MRISQGDWKCPGDFIYVFWLSLNYKKKLLTNKQKLGIYAHPLGLSVGKKGLGLEGLMDLIFLVFLALFAGSKGPKIP